MLPLPQTTPQGSSMVTGLQGKVPQGTDSMERVFRETQSQGGGHKGGQERNLKC